MYDYKCDIKLKVAGANFKAHRDVLAEASDYFSAMFSHDMLEREKDVVELHGMSPGGFTVILDYFYHGHITIDHNNIEDVLEVTVLSWRSSLLTADHSNIDDNNNNNNNNNVHFFVPFLYTR